MNTAGFNYVYYAHVVRIVDGDTVVLDVDLGFRVNYQMTVRMWGINAPEMNTKEGKEVKTWLEGKLPVGMAVTFDSRKDKADKYGRFLAVLWVGDDEMSVNDQMVKAGLAVEYMR